MLECRLDNVLVRLGFAASRRQSRQLVRHGHWSVNGRRVDIPSYQVRPGDVIAVKAGTGAEPAIRDATELTGQVPAWLQADHDSLTAKVLRRPERKEIAAPVAGAVDRRAVLEVVAPRRRGGESAPAPLGARCDPNTTIGLPRCSISRFPASPPKPCEDNRGSFTVEPLERGFGYTFGNSLRRVLLSSLQGAAVTSVRIEGVAHEFSTINGVKEDVTDIVLNLKGVVCRMHSDATEVEAPLVATGPGEITAKDIDLPAGVEILNPDSHVATLEKKTKLEVYLTIGSGRGYRPAEDNKSDDQPIGVIPIDSIFSPVRRVAYAVEQARVGQRTDFDKLTLDIETDGSVEPQAALREAAEILIGHLSIFTDAEISELPRPGGPGGADRSRRRRGPGGDDACPQRDGRHPDRGAGAGRALLQLPQASGHPDGR